MSSPGPFLPAEAVAANGKTLRRCVGGEPSSSPYKAYPLYPYVGCKSSLGPRGHSY